MDESGLVYIGVIVSLDAIGAADFIVSASVDCGKGGNWSGIVQKGQFTIGDLCTTYLPDALIPPSDDMKFMESSNWRVRMRRFRGAASEVVIMPLTIADGKLGDDCTAFLGVIKYHKPVPENLQGIAVGPFPSFIPKTDEPNYQSIPEFVEMLQDKPYYITEKADGSSTTAFKYKGEFGVCGRNWQLLQDSANGYWKVAEKYNLSDKLPEGYAIQWETCGPKIQGNPMGLKEIDGFAFNVYNIPEHRYLNVREFVEFCHNLDFPLVGLEKVGEHFDMKDMPLLGEGEYPNRKQREGVVIRSQENLLSHKPISFKVINLNYEK